MLFRSISKIVPENEFIPSEFVMQAHIMKMRQMSAEVVMVSVLNYFK